MQLLQFAVLGRGDDVDHAVGALGHRLDLPGALAHLALGGETGLDERHDTVLDVKVVDEVRVSRLARLGGLGLELLCGRVMDGRRARAGFDAVLSLELALETALSAWHACLRYAHAERVLDADQALLLLEQRAVERDCLMTDVLGLLLALVHELLQLRASVLELA